MRQVLAFILLLISVSAFADDQPGHSSHGSAFDSGMRTRPWAMDGIGEAPFPITAKNPEVQKWFNQGNALLHSFWFEEAERSFRWCLKLDPVCAMAYWSLARCGFNWFAMGAPNFDDKDFDRYKAFLKEAVRREDKVSDRERMYIEAWAQATAPGVKEGRKVLVAQLQKIVIKYPDDVEAKAHLALFNIGDGSAFANELLIEQVLAKKTDAPRRPPREHSQLGRSLVRAGDTELRTIRKVRARHWPRPSHAGAHIHQDWNVARGGDRDGFRDPDRTPLHERPAGSAV